MIFNALGNFALGETNAYVYYPFAGIIAKSGVYYLPSPDASFSIQSESSVLDLPAGERLSIDF